ncbi:MAG: sigma-70 family RNA polymerase sigma factor [Sphingomonas sp.]
MSKTTAALEAAVALVIENTPSEAKQTARQRVAADRAFADILKLIAPRIRHFVRQYGLTQYWDDAEQCCAIGVHRAIQAYDPTRAKFTTFVNWQLRGELQSLRFRMATDQRPSAKKVEATTISLQSIRSDDEDSVSLEALIEDEDALDRTESAAADFMADQVREALLDTYVDHLRTVGVDQLKRRARATRSTQRSEPSLPRFRAGAAVVNPEELAALEAKLAEQRRIVDQRLRDEGATPTQEDPMERERLRQVAKRATQAVADLAAADPRFPGLTERRSHPRRRKTDAAPAKATALPDANAPHNKLAQVIEIAPPAPIETGDAALDGAANHDRLQPDAHASIH